MRDQLDIFHRLLIANKYFFCKWDVRVTEKSSRIFHMSELISNVVMLSLYRMLRQRIWGMNEWAHMIEFVIPAYTPHQRRNSSSFNMSNIFTQNTLVKCLKQYNLILYFSSLNFFLPSLLFTPVPILASVVAAVNERKTTQSTRLKRYRMSRDYECFTSDKILNTDDTYRHALGARILRSHHASDLSMFDDWRRRRRHCWMDRREQWAEHEKSKV